MSAAQPFLGTWRIIDMEVWDKDAFDMVGPAHFSFGKDDLGNFQFIAVEGEMDCRFGQRDGRPLVEFSWTGCDETDPASGRGWAVLDGDTMTGRIFVHGGDDSAVRAKRAKSELRRGSRQRNG